VSDQITAAGMEKMIAYNGADAARSHHALKVYALARAIGLEEGLSGGEQEILELAALLHDIGIHESEKKYGSAAGEFQQIEGPPIARRILEECGAAQSAVERVCYLVSRHHTYSGIDGRDYQILVEADFLVNLFEAGMKRDAAESVCANIFKTRAGIRMLKEMYLTDEKA